MDREGPERISKQTVSYSFDEQPHSLGRSLPYVKFAPFDEEGVSDVSLEDDLVAVPVSKRTAQLYDDPKCFHTHMPRM